MTQLPQAALHCQRQGTNYGDNPEVMAASSIRPMLAIMHAHYQVQEAARCQAKPSQNLAHQIHVAPAGSNSSKVGRAACSDVATMWLMTMGLGMSCARVKACPGHVQDFEEEQQGTQQQQGFQDKQPYRFNKREAQIMRVAMDTMHMAGMALVTQGFAIFLMGERSAPVRAEAGILAAAAAWGSSWDLLRSNLPSRILLIPAIAAARISLKKRASMHGSKPPR